MNDVSATTKKLLALSMLRGVGPSTLRKMAAIADFESIDLDALAGYFSSISSVLRDVNAWSRAQESAARQIDEAHKLGARIVSAVDIDYPALLALTSDDPFLLWVRGRFHAAPNRAVAVIGTREPTAHGQIIAERITRHFVDQNWSIISGLALGCDAIAHRAALSSGGHTVAVLAHGLQTVAPAKHRDLAEDILSAGGALVSEFRIGQSPLPQQFVKRDRTQAGLAQGVVMVQSDLKGGSLHASRAALDYKRWLAVPYPTDIDRQRGEPKIQANLRIAEGSDSERMQLLECTAPALRSVHVLRSKDDYALLESAYVEPRPSLPPSQRALI